MASSDVVGHDCRNVQNCTTVEGLLYDCHGPYLCGKLVWTLGFFFQKSCQWIILQKFTRDYTIPRVQTNRERAPLFSGQLTRHVKREGCHIIGGTFAELTNQTEMRAAIDGYNIVRYIFIVRPVKVLYCSGARMIFCTVQQYMYCTAHTLRRVKYLYILDIFCPNRIGLLLGYCIGKLILYRIVQDPKLMTYSTVMYRAPLSLQTVWFPIWCAPVDTCCISPTNMCTSHTFQIPCQSCSSCCCHTEWSNQMVSSESGSVSNYLTKQCCPKITRTVGQPLTRVIVSVAWITSAVSVPLKWM